MHSGSVGSSSIPPLESGAHRLERALWFAAGCVPFCNLSRLPPMPMFWGEWSSVALLLFWLVLRPHRGSRHAWVIPGVVVGMAALVAVMLVQQVLGMVAQPITLVVGAALLALAASLTCASASIDDAVRRSALARALASGLVAALLLNAMVVVLGWLGYEPLMLHVYPAPTLARAVGLIGQANQLGTLSVLGLVAGFYLHAERRLPLTGLWAVALVSAIVIASTSSRVAWLQWLVAMAWTAWWGRGRELSVGFKPRVLLGLTVLFALVQGAWLALGSASPGSVQNASVFARTADAGRIEMLHDAFALWLKHPLLGVGYGNFAAARLHELDGPVRHLNTDHAHNLFAQALVEWGAVGLVIVLALIAWLLRAAWQRSREPSAGFDELLAATVLLCLLTHSMVEHPLWFMNFLLLLALLIGMIRQPSVWRSMAPVGRRPTLAAIQVMVALAIVVASALDYRRIENLALMFRAEVGRPAETPSRLRLQDMADVDLMTLFPRYPRIMMSMLLPMNDESLAAKLVVARQAMDSIPSGEGIARYAMFSALAGREDEARSLLQGVSHRAPAEYDLAYGWMIRWSEGNPRLSQFVESLPLGRPVDTLLVPPRR